MKIFNILYYLFIAAIAVIAILLLVSVFPITGNFKVLTVLSGSMEPAIRVGSIVVVKPVAEYKVGDIITFGKISKTQTPTTHRISDIKTEGGKTFYITKGDANNAPDARPVAKSEVAGKVLFSVPYAGYAVSVARKPYGFILIIVIPAAIIIYDELKKIRDEIKRIKNKKQQSTVMPDSFVTPDRDPGRHPGEKSPDGSTK